MFGFGIWEVVVILLVALLVIGPDKLPEVARQIGKGLRELRRAGNELQNTFHEAVYTEEAKELRERYKPPQIQPATGAEPREGESILAAGSASTAVEEPTAGSPMTSDAAPSAGVGSGTASGAAGAPPNATDAATRPAGHTTRDKDGHATRR